MQYYPERQELMVSLLDSSEEEMERLCAGLVDTSIEPYDKCDKGRKSMVDLKWSGINHIQVFAEE